MISGRPTAIGQPATEATLYSGGGGLLCHHLDLSLVITLLCVNEGTSEIHGVGDAWNRCLRVAGARDDDGAEIENTSKYALIDLNAFDLVDIDFDAGNSIFKHVLGISDLYQLWLSIFFPKLIPLKMAGGFKKMGATAAQHATHAVFGR